MNMEGPFQADEFSKAPTLDSCWLSCAPCAVHVVREIQKLFNVVLWQLVQYLSVKTVIICAWEDDNFSGTFKNWNNELNSIYAV